jgi:hypothetical protein
METKIYNCMTKRFVLSNNNEVGVVVRFDGEKSIKYVFTVLEIERYCGGFTNWTKLDWQVEDKDGGREQIMTVKDLAHRDAGNMLIPEKDKLYVSVSHPISHQLRRGSTLVEIRVKKYGPDGTVASDERELMSIQ